MRKTKLYLLIVTIFCAFFMSASVFADTATQQSVVCTYSKADNTVKLSVYVSGGDAIVGFCSFSYDNKTLVLTDTSGNPVPNDVPATAADGKTSYLKSVVSAHGGIVVTDMGKGVKKLVNPTDGYVLFAWYLPQSSKSIDASSGRVLIAEINFKLADTKVYTDIQNGIVKLAGNNITDPIGNWYSGILAMNSAHKQYATSNGTMTVNIKYEFDLSDNGGTASEPSKPTETDKPDQPENPDGNGNAENPGETQKPSEPSQPDEPKDGENTGKTDDGNSGETLPEKTDFGIVCTPFENSVRIRWNTPEGHGDVLGYELYGTDTDGNTVFEIDDISPISNSYTVRDLGGGFDMKVRVRAYFSDGTSADSEYSDASTLGISEDAELISFEVKYDVKNGFLYGFDTEKVVFGKTAVKLPDVVPVVGMKFDGWSVDGKTVTDVSKIRIYSDETFYAVYSRKSAGAYMTGYSDGTFKPDGVITRAETAALIARISGVYNADETYNTDFSDCAQSAWFTNYVGCCIQNGFITGYSDGTFRPERTVTRAEFAAILCRVFGYKRTSQNDNFNDISEHWAADSINALFDYSVVSPESDGSFRPDDKLLRKEAVSMLNAALGIEPDKSGIDNYVAQNGQPFSDVPESSPYYYDILSAALGK